jgi:hypothetical protein
MTYAMARPLGYLGDTGSAAGPVNGIATLRVDVQRSAQNVAEVYGSDVSYDRGAYERIMRRFRGSSPPSTAEMSGAEMKAFILGVMADVIGALARAEQLSLRTVRTEAERSENMRAQAELIGAARIMLDSANQAVGSARRSSSGASGLGNPLVVAGIIAAAAVIWIVVGSFIVLAAEAQLRLVQARSAAERICRQEGGCTPEQRAALVHRLSLGPLDRIAEGIGEGAESGGLAIGTIAVIGGAGVLAIGGMWFLFGTAAGRRTLKGMREAS